MLSYQLHSILLGEGANSGFTLSKTPLRCSESLPFLKATRYVLWYVLPRWRGRFHSFKTCEKISFSTLILVITCR